MTTAERHIMEVYAGIIKSLSSAAKLELIEKLMRKFSMSTIVNRSILFGQLMVLSIAPFTVCAQSGEWFESGASWSYNFQVAGLVFTETRIASFQITEQTIFQDQECAKMELMDANWAPFSTWNPCIPAAAPYYFYESNDSIFYASEIDNTFRLAYNFGAEVDDNWLFVVPADSGWDDFSGVDTFLVSVLSVGQVSLDGQNLKVMELAYENISSIIHTVIEPFTVTVIERLGSSQYFFIPIFDIGGEFWACEGAWNIELQCYNSASLNYQNPDFNSCTLSADKIQNEHSISVYPNPSNASFQVSLPDANERIERVEMYDMQGRSIAHTSHLEGSQARIEIHNLTTGVYLVKAGSVKGVYTQKLVVE